MCLFGKAPAAASAPAPTGAVPNGSLEKGSSSGALQEPEPFCVAAGEATKPSFSWLLLCQGVKGRSGPLLVQA
jgi:hypothetical protein